eukprot:TRINITY_DN4642_c0_g1_i1.p1 TRINITY_DN4642_c0_g1~~TRINITY_DN4642_c0_g1_i1.p1  ORF type:complete len:296 (-),score=74.68 TRINITY_DN4642_c0_g1_i1:194-1081(-)
MSTVSEELNAFAELLRSRQEVNPNDKRMENIYGRVVKIFKSHDGFNLQSDRLSPYNNRIVEIAEELPYVFALGIDGLAKVSRLSIPDILLDVLCWKKDRFYYDQLRQIHDGTLKLFLVAFDASLEADGFIHPASVDGIFDLLQDEFPQCYVRMKRVESQLRELQRLPLDEKFQEFRSLHGPWSAEWKRVWLRYADDDERIKLADHQFMSVKRFESIPIENITLADCRRFLHDVFMCGEYFAFEGVTINLKGEKSCEFLVKNMLIADMKAVSYIELEMKSHDLGHYLETISYLAKD